LSFAKAQLDSAAVMLQTMAMLEERTNSDSNETTGGNN